MTDRTDLDLLTEAVARLPRQRSSAGFTQRTLQAIDRRSVLSRAWTQRLTWAATMAVLIVIGLTLGHAHQRQRAADRAYRQQVEDLQSRYQELLQEVTSVRQQAARTDTRLYLGGDESLDLVLDLGQLHPAGIPDTRTQHIRPASLEQ